MFNSKLKDLRQDGLVDAVNLIGISGVDANRSGLYSLKRIRFEALAGWWFGTFLFSHILGIIIPID